MTVAARLSRNALATAAGLLASRVVPPLPDAVHPVARFGRSMTELEDLLWADDRRHGVAYAAVGTALGAAVGRSARSTALVVAVAAAGEHLRGAAGTIGDHLAAGDLDAARAALPTLVGRDPSTLDASGIAAAAVESVAENTVDAVFATALWGLVAGGPGAAAHRAVNTMDAMVGRQDERYGRFGWAAARLDDAAAWIPARLFAAVVAAARPDRAGAVARTVARDAPAHPSPNAGVAEAAVAAALGRELGGPLVYGTTHEDRPRLGEGPRPHAADVAAAIALTRRCEDLLVGGLVLVGVLAGLAGPWAGRLGLRGRR